ncbi:FAD-dependent oxidoreductase [Sphingomonas xanthus]|uniref:FAD-dependent oxidoreductase n=1 Tax=Sphingomonas xanthus TaxID=2594473 RepID=A0A516IPS7_9SPHN|nr:FAD-dependent oxidoreductase [Sphingomonas xanthus]QDP18866.1 FAD-dependent oxidoreductase [Sphingomonas xanthus]
MTEAGKGSRASLPSLTRRSLIGGMTAGAIAPAVLRASKPGSAGHIAVVGAGVFGAWTAEHLHRAGHRVTLVDMAGPAHGRASSGGESRMTRAAYGKDDIYTRMAWASLAEWKALSDRAALPLFHPHGVLFFSNVADDYFRGSIAVHRQLNLPIEELDRAGMQRRFPMIDFDGVGIGLYEPGFGALMARRSVQTLVRGFTAAGGRFLHEAAHVVQQGAGRPAALRLGSGAMLEADTLVFALGPWLPKLFPDLLGRRIFATRQEIFYFAAPPGDRLFQPAAMPGWADFNGGEVFYGFPDLEARGLKFANDQHGVLVDPDTQSREPTRAAIDQIIAFRDRRFPLLRGAPLIGAEVCQYENSSNGDFLIDRHPTLPNVVLVGGGSGHGFKHGPEVGRRAAALAFGGRQEEPRFTLATKDETQKREVH